jgi:hypothetical protein
MRPDGDESHRKGESLIYWKNWIIRENLPKRTGIFYERTQKQTCPFNWGRLSLFSMIHPNLYKQSENTWMLFRISLSFEDMVLQRKCADSYFCSWPYQTPTIQKRRSVSKLRIFHTFLRCGHMRKLAKVLPLYGKDSIGCQIKKLLL